MRLARMSSPPSATWSVVACADSTRTRSTSRSPASSATTSKSTSSSRCSLEAQLQHGALHEWYGERVTSTLFKGVVPDGYGVINLPHRPPVHLLLELDRGTEPARRLHDKAVLYARQIPRSQLGERDAFVVLTVPTARRAKARTRGRGRDRRADRGRRVEQGQHALSARDRHQRRRANRRTASGTRHGSPGIAMGLPALRRCPAISACPHVPLSDP